MSAERKRILIIQTAFIGDVILATSLIEFFKGVFINAEIDFVLRKSNALILEGDPRVNRLIKWDKSQQKIKGLLKVIKEIREVNYDFVINTHRFGSSGLMTAFSKSKAKIGYDNNPLSFFYTKKIKHIIGDGRHEVDRLKDLVMEISDEKLKPKLHTSALSREKVSKYQNEPYIVIAPNSVWFTKQYPLEKWIEFLDNSSFNGNVYPIGAPSEISHSQRIVDKTKRQEVINLCGDLSLIESAALMSGAQMNYTNDSGPMHLCSAVNAPVKAIYCSTIPAYGFGPLSDDSEIIETKIDLPCRSCGVHGHNSCPEGHFKCGTTISWEQLEINKR